MNVLKERKYHQLEMESLDNVIVFSNEYQIPKSGYWIIDDRSLSMIIDLKTKKETSQIALSGSIGTSASKTGGRGFVAGLYRNK